MISEVPGDKLLNVLPQFPDHYSSGTSNACDHDLYKEYDKFEYYTLDNWYVNTSGKEKREEHSSTLPCCIQSAAN